MKLFYLDFTA